MKAPACVRCKAIVLEMEGQFEKLDSFYLGEGGPPPESAGYWHSSCLHESGRGLAWYEARLKNFVEVRRYKLLATVSPWSVVQGARSKGALALSQAGDLISLYKPSGKIGAVEGGTIYRVEEDEFHLALEETDVIRAVQEALSSKGTFPVMSLLAALKVSDRTSHPQSLADSVLTFDGSLQRCWTASNVSARWSYGVFIPAQLEAYVTLR